MHVGVGLTFSNLDNKYSDTEVYQNELALADRVEPLGFDSLWSPEHHFSGYQMTPLVTQFLSWAAGRTERIRLGSFVTIIPWHDPVRVCETFALLDQLSGGRAVLGMGRGLSPDEFTGFRSDMGTSRQRFTEYATAIINGLRNGYIEADGEFYQQPRVAIRPGPVASFEGRTFASGMSPASFDIMADLGVGIMFSPQKPWPTMLDELASYRARYVEINGEGPPKPVPVVMFGVGATEEQALTFRNEYLLRFARSSVEHYKFHDPTIASVPGYEYYAKLQENIHRHGLEKFNAFLADLNVWGTPDQVTAKMLDIVDKADAGGLVMLPCYGGMPPDLANANLELFAAEVLPTLKSHDVGGDLGVRHQPAAAFSP